MENVFTLLSAGKQFFLETKGDRYMQFETGVFNFFIVKEKSKVKQSLENKEQYDAMQKLLNPASPQVIRNILWPEVVKAADRP